MKEQKMRILTHKQSKSSKSDERVKVILLDTPEKQATIGIIMPKTAKTARTEQSLAREYKNYDAR